MNDTTLSTDVRSTVEESYDAIEDFLLLSIRDMKRLRKSDRAILRAVVMTATNTAIQYLALQGKVSL